MNDIERRFEILLVEDSPIDARIIQEGFHELQVPHQIRVVDDGEKALAFLHRGVEYTDAPRPDLILLDLYLPKVSGFNVLAAIKATGHLRTIPVIILTSSEDSDDVARACELQANCYLTKPRDLSGYVSLARTIEQFWLRRVKLPSPKPASGEHKDWEGAGIDGYDRLGGGLPTDYHSLLDPKESQQAIFDVKRYMEEGLCRQLNLMMVTVPLIVDADSGVSDLPNRGDSPAPVPCHISNDYDRNPIDAQVVKDASKWKRLALNQFGLRLGEGICTDMRSVQTDGFLDHDHSAYVDQWDWELGISDKQRSIEFLTDVIQTVWKVLKGAERHLQDCFPKLKADRYPDLPDNLTFFHAEDILAEFPNLPPNQRESRILEDHPAVFICGVGYPLADGHPHETRAADGDDWSTVTTSKDGRPMHGLNGKLVVWNPVTQRRHRVASIGIRVDAESLRKQLEMAGQLEFLEFPYYQAIIHNEVPLSIGGGIGQSRTSMLLLKKAHLGEVSVSVWPQVLRQMCARKNIRILQ